MDEFEEFLASKGIAMDDQRVPLLKEVWNRAIKCASDWLKSPDVEGSDFGIEGFKVP